MATETLQEYEAAIEATIRGEFAVYAEGRGEGEWHMLDRKPTPAERCDRLYGLQGHIRRTLWSRPYRAWARQLYERCCLAISVLQQEHGLAGPSRAPLFEGGYLGNSYVNAIE